MTSAVIIALVFQIFLIVVIWTLGIVFLKGLSKLKKYKKKNESFFESLVAGVVAGFLVLFGSDWVGGVFIKQFPVLDVSSGGTLFQSFIGTVIYLLLGSGMVFTAVLFVVFLGTAIIRMNK